MNLHAATDRRRQSSVSRAELRRILENCAIARPSDRDALRKQHCVVWYLDVSPMESPDQPPSDCTQETVVAVFRRNAFLDPGNYKLTS